jgi:hypothetical protein
MEDSWGCMGKRKKRKKEEKGDRFIFPVCHSIAGTEIPWHAL